MKTISIIFLLFAFIATTAFVIYHVKTASFAFSTAKIRVKETFICVLFGVFLWIEAAALCLTMPQNSFSQYTAAFKGNILVFLAASIVLGSFIIFYYFVKGVYIYEDRIDYVSVVGKKTEVLWEEIIDIKITQMQRVKLFYGPNSSITVGGEKKDFKEFLRFAIRLLPESVDKNQLIAIGTRYKI